MRPLVSVLIDTYNHEQFIEQAILSVLEQDFARDDVEIIVVDDGSTDRTPEIVRRFAPRVRLLSKANGGQASAFNLGIPECRSKVIAFLDGDDWWACRKLTRVLQALAADPSVGIVGHGIINVHRDGREQSEVLREGLRFQANTLAGARLLRRRGSFLGTSRMTIRADALRRIGRVPEEIEIQADEYLSTLTAALVGVQILPETLTYYRHHESNNFQLASNDPKKLRRKQMALSALAKSLSQRLEDAGIDARVRKAVVEFPKASADQLRLMMDGGWPWETTRTEWKIYRISHPDARISHRVFKLAVLMAALVVTPRVFYRMQRALAQNTLYRRIRRHWLKIPEMQHIRKDWRTRT